MIVEEIVDLRAQVYFKAAQFGIRDRRQSRPIVHDPLIGCGIIRGLRSSLPLHRWASQEVCETLSVKPCEKN
jgi:hypothetical protein